MNLDILKMEFIQHTISWCKGEILEGKIILLYAGVLTLISILLWQFGNTANAKALFVPLLVVGILFGSLGGGMIYSNTKRMAEFRQAFQSKPNEFIQAEKIRTEEFMKWYP